MPAVWWCEPRSHERKKASSPLSPMSDVLRPMCVRCTMGDILICQGGRELRLGVEEGKKRGRVAGRLTWLAPQPPRDRAPGAPLGRFGGSMDPAELLVPVGCRGRGETRRIKQCAAGSRRLRSRQPACREVIPWLYGRMKESRKLDARSSERYSCGKRTVGKRAPGNLPLHGNGQMSLSLSL